jgi:hypothetical protein
MVPQLRWQKLKRFSSWPRNKARNSAQGGRTPVLKLLEASLCVGQVRIYNSTW